MLAHKKYENNDSKVKKTRSLKALSTYSVILIYEIASLFLEIFPTKPEVTFQFEIILSDSCLMEFMLCSAHVEFDNTLLPRFKL